MILTVLSFSLVGCLVDKPSDDQGFCLIYSKEDARCRPLDKGEPIPDKQFDIKVVDMLGYSCMSPEFNKKIQLYIEELKQQCGDPCK